MAPKKTPAEAERQVPVNLNDYYFPAEAAQRLSQNSGKTVTVDAVRKLGNLGLIGKLKVNPRMSLYLKADVDPYVVEDRGIKAARKQQERAHARKQAQQSSLDEAA